MEKTSRLISIIVPVYNVERYIDECLNSVINQTYKHIEIILVDDGSKDSSGKICDNYAEKDNRIVVVHKENGGLSDARNAGMKVATGEYIMFVDSDDYITLDAVERFCCTIGQKGSVDMIVANGKNLPGAIMRPDFDDAVMNRIVSGEEYLNIAHKLKRHLVGAPFYLYNSQFLREHELFFERGILHEDVRFTTVALCYAERISFLPGYFYYYRNNPDSIMHRKDYSKNCRDIYDSCLYLEDFLQSKLKKETFDLVMEWLVRQYLGIFRCGKCYQYGKEYIHKDFVRKYAKFKKTRMKSLLFRISPRLYCRI